MSNVTRPGAGLGLQEEEYGMGCAPGLCPPPMVTTEQASRVIYSEITNVLFFLKKKKKEKYIQYKSYIHNIF